MNHKRIEQLKIFLAQEPNDVFLLYALAQEYLNTDTEKAKFYFNQIIDKDKDYLPTYYALGNLYAQLAEYSQAKNILERGIELAQKLQDTKTLRELQSLYDNLS